MKNRGRPKKQWPQLTKTLYQSMLQIWHERPNMKYISEELELPMALVKNVKENGIPELGLNSFPASISKKRKNVTVPDVDGITHEAECMIAHQTARQHAEAIKENLSTIKKTTEKLEQSNNLEEADQILSGSMAEIDKAETRIAREQSRVVAISKKSIALDNMQRSATEAAMARQATDNCLKLAAVMSYFTDGILKNIEEGEVTLPKRLDSRLLMALANSNDRLTSAMERAVKLEKGRGGEPDQNVGMQIGMMFNDCSLTELDEFLDKGVLPSRIKNLPTDDGSN